MQNQLFIPDKIKVGYQKRNDTYTGKLAYVIYYDKKGVLRKETSWQGWRDNKIKADEFENVPTEGFVLNKGVGGARQSYGWNARNEYIRVYDPRGFEFEISVANLLFILQESSSIKGKGLEGEFAYCWEGKELALLPCDSAEYKNSMEFSNLQDKKVTRADMTPGCLYQAKNQRNLMYLGRFTWYEKQEYYHKIDVFKCHVFRNTDTNKFEYEKGFTKLALKLTDTPAENFSDMVEEYNNSKYGAKIVGLEHKPFTITKKAIDKASWLEYFYVKEADGYVGYQINENHNYNYTTQQRENMGYSMTTEVKIKFVNGEIKFSTIDYNSKQDKNKVSLDEINKLDFSDLKLILESGSKVSYNKY